VTESYFSQADAFITDYSQCQRCKGHLRGLYCHSQAMVGLQLTLATAEQVGLLISRRFRAGEGWKDRR